MFMCYDYSSELTIEQIKKEFEYYSGEKIADDEAEEILHLIEANPSASLSEIISDYCGC